MKLVFCQNWLTEASEDVLKILLPYHRARDKGTLPELEELCVELLSSCAPDIFASQYASSFDIPYRRCMWSLVADRWRVVESSRPWRDIAIFLSVPLKYVSPTTMGILFFKI